jgi:Mce-associated membrane protein
MTATDVREPEQQSPRSGPDASLDSGQDESTPPREGRTSSGFRRGLAFVLALVLVVSLGIAIWLAAVRRGEAGDVQRERETVMAQSRQFLLRMGTYGPDLLDQDDAMPEYRARVSEVITPKFKASFEQEAGVAERLVAQGRASREAEVFATGVSDLDPDSATALVAGTFTDTYEVDGEPVTGEPVPFRIEVSLVKIDGEWLVDDFTPVTGTDAGDPEEGVAP